MLFFMAATSEDEENKSVMVQEHEKDLTYVGYRRNE